MLPTPSIISILDVPEPGRINYTRPFLAPVISSLTPTDPRNARQKHAYTHQCHIYRALRSTNPTSGLVSTDTWAVVALNVFCHYEYTQNDDDPNIVARIKRRTALTEDRLHCPSVTNVRSGDILVDTTPGSPNQLTVHRVQGVARIRPAAGGRGASKLTVQLMQEEKPPAGIPGGG